MAAEIEVRRESGHIEVHFARPRKLNALTAAMYAEAADALEALNADPALHSLVFSGAGMDFCAGNDVSEFLDDYDLARGKPWRRFLEGLASAQKPLIAAVHGRAIGIGMTLLLHCDFVYGEPNCRFSAPFAQLGVVPEAGSSLLLPRLVGPRRAADIFILGRAMQAEEALQSGLITRIVEPGGARAVALEVAAKLAQLPPKTIAETIRLLRQNGSGIPERIDDECKAFMACLQTEETRAVLAGILGKTKPRA